MKYNFYSECVFAQKYAGCHVTATCEATSFSRKEVTFVTNLVFSSLVRQSQAKAWWCEKRTATLGVVGVPCLECCGCWSGGSSGRGGWLVGGDIQCCSGDRKCSCLGVGWRERVLQGNSYLGWWHIGALRELQYTGAMAYKIKRIWSISPSFIHVVALQNETEIKLHRWEAPVCECLS